MITPATVADWTMFAGLVGTVSAVGAVGSRWLLGDVEIEGMVATTGAGLPNPSTGRTVVPRPERSTPPHRDTRRGRTALRTTGRVSFRRATSLNPARPYRLWAPNHMKSGWLGSSLSTG